MHPTHAFADAVRRDAGPGRVAVAALTAGVVLSGGAGVLGPTLATNPPARESVTVPVADTLGQVLFGCLLLGAAWAVGRAASRERTYAARAAEQSARQALSDERQRIARELHDIVAHSMSLIAVKAGVANHVADARPHEAREALHLIESTSRGALVDTQAAIDGLKDGRIGYLGLDVYEEEEDLFFQDLSNRVIQDDVFSRLLTFPNVLVTAHQAFFTREALGNIAETTLGNVTAFERGETLANRIVWPPMA